MEEGITVAGWAEINRKADNHNRCGQDRIGIIAGVTNVLADARINILDISQTIMQEFFTMILVADMTESTVELGELKERLAKG